ncbi:hypothetical protein [Falsiroseomonas sp.]|uniref:hypothetical protein n=1 Tax=Falsiroseomonas sp. TaxID=2870721 RepID=UPI002732E083|nr:hypothetical protein [Falsiroseomonas sp.]MDP3417945.1 hypothetical protein [Falsiroseomonas sp.]
MTTLLLDNGHSVIRHHRTSHGSCGVLVVTFAEMYQNDPSKPGFGQDFLLTAGFDVVTVQKRSELWYQDLSPESFRAAVAPVASQYSRVVTYGVSMGAFAALLYAGAIGASALALSPMVSIHPHLPGAQLVELRGKVELRHIYLTDAPRGDGTIVVIYDPLMSHDQLYVEREVMPAFPDAKIVRLPRGDHPVARALWEMGILQSLVVGFLREGQVPAARFERPHRGQSSVYLANLATHCARRGRVALGLRLFDRAIDLAQDWAKPALERRRSAFARRRGTGD